MILTVYNTKTGKINRIVDAPDIIAQLQAGEGEAWITGSSDDLTQYVNIATKQIEDRPLMDAILSKPTFLADGLDMVMLGNLPQPCTVILKGQSWRVEDGIFSLTTDIPGSFLLTVQAWPYLNAEFAVEALPCA
jgi:hypothetical protein